MASGNKKSGTKTSSNKKISGNLNSRSRTKQTRANVKKTGTTRMTKKQLAAEQARQRRMRNEIILIVIFAFSIFLLIANFRICGIVGDVVSGFFFWNPWIQ